jgi:hypothetical protein
MDFERARLPTTFVTKETGAPNLDTGISESIQIEDGRSVSLAHMTLDE